MTVPMNLNWQNNQENTKHFRIMQFRPWNNTYCTNHKKLSRQHTLNMRAVESIQPSKMKSQTLEAHHASFPCHSQTCHWQAFGGCFGETSSNETASVRVNFSTTNDWCNLSSFR